MGGSIAIRGAEEFPRKGTVSFPFRVFSLVSKFQKRDLGGEGREKETKTQGKHCARADKSTEKGGKRERDHLLLLFAFLRFSAAVNSMVRGEREEVFFPPSSLLSFSLFLKTSSQILISVESVAGQACH